MHLPLPLLLLLALPSLSFCFPPLRLCHTNDFHAKYNEVGSSNVACKWQAAITDDCYSGISRLVTLLHALQCDVKVQAGDWVQGSLLDTVYHERIGVPAYLWAGYDIATFGNHEFDTGPALVNVTVRHTGSVINWLSSNVYFDDPTMQDLPLHRYLDLHDICWVAATTTTTPFSSSPGDTVRFLDETESMRAALQRCAQTERVIAVTHQGYDADLALCEAVSELDLVIGGHSHTDLSNGRYPTKVARKDGSVCWVVQAFAHGRYVGVLDLWFENGVIQFSTTGYMATDARIARHPETLLKLELFNRQTTELVKEVIGEVVDVVWGGTAPCRGGTECDHPGYCECSMGNLVCDAMRAWTGEADDVVCLINGGGLRASIEKGKVTIRDVVNVLPFGNEIVAFTLSGQQVLQQVRYGLGALLEARAGGEGAWIGGLANMHVDASIADDVEIHSVKVAGKEIDEKATYTLLTNSYMAAGGDGYTFDQEGDNVGVMLREATQEYLEQHIPYAPAVGRLRVAAAAQRKAVEPGVCGADSCGAQFETEL